MSMTETAVNADIHREHYFSHKFDLGYLKFLNFLHLACKAFRFFQWNTRKAVKHADFQMFQFSINFVGKGFIGDMHSETAQLFIQYY